MLKDFGLREKIFDFDHARSPERVVHVRGYGAHGAFTCIRAVDDLTRGRAFCGSCQNHGCFMRFPTVAGSKGSPDLPHDIGGAVAFYAEGGNGDLVGNTMPVFLIPGAMKFPDPGHPLKPAPDRDFPQAHGPYRDVIALTPEAMHRIKWLMSDRRLPRFLATMEGCGGHSFRVFAADGAAGTGHGRAIG